MKNAFLFPLILLTVVLSCRSEVYYRLNRAETLLSQYPDSALYLLENIPKECLSSKKLDARYALLKSAALDKNYVDIASDSLTRKAVDYYSGRNDKRSEMLAWYYHALVLIHANSCLSAIIALEEAENLAITLNDNYQLGLILSNKGLVFKLTNNIPAAIECWRQAIECFDVADKVIYKAYAELDLAIDYINDRQFEKADSLLTYIRETYDHKTLNYYCNVHQAGILVETDQAPETAIALYEATPTKYYSLQDYGYLATSYDSIYLLDSSDFWFNKGYSLCRNQADSASIDYMKAKVEVNRGHFKMAFNLIDHAATVQDSLTRILLQQSVNAAQRDYYKSETLLREEKIRTMRQRSVYGVVVGLLVLSLLATTTIALSRKKDRLLQEQMARLALDERELVRVNRDNAHLIGSLFSERIDHLDELCEAYFKAEDVKEKESIFKQVKNMAAMIRKDDSLFLSLERDLDRYCNNIMKKIRSQVPRIQGDNLRTILLFFAGFSYETVLIILNKNSIESLKMARSRFRKVIREAEAPDAEFFLQMLEMKKRPQAGTNKSVGVS